MSKITSKKHGSQLWSSDTKKLYWNYFLWRKGKAVSRSPTTQIRSDLIEKINMSVWHMLNICLIYVKTKLKKPWQPTVVFCYKKNYNGTNFFGDRVRRYCGQGQAILTLFWHKKNNSLSLRYG